MGSPMPTGQDAKGVENLPVDSSSSLQGEQSVGAQRNKPALPCLRVKRNTSRHAWLRDKLIWLSRIIADIRNSESEIISVAVDNNGAIDSAHNSATNQRNKHIDLLYHFVRDAVQSERIKLKYCSSEDMLADSLTKPLPPVQLERLRDSQGTREQTF